MSKFRKIVAKVLKVSERKITEETSPMNVSSWDSFRGLLLITELEKAYGCKFSMEDVLSMKNIGDIKKALRKYKVDPDR